MSETPPNPWIHIGECPVCVNGLVRVRTCKDDCIGVHFSAVCDECEAIWLEPDTASEKFYADAEQPGCPICTLALFGEQSHWSLPDELKGTKWEAQSIYDVPSTSIGGDQLAAKSGEAPAPAEIDEDQDHTNPGC